MERFLARRRALPRPACGERGGVRGLLKVVRIPRWRARHRPSPGIRAQCADSDLSPQAGRGYWARSQFFHKLSAHRALCQSVNAKLTVPLRQRPPALVWKIHLLHRAQTRLVQNAAIAGHTPGTLSRLGTQRIQGQCAALPKITQEIPVSLQACHGGQRRKPGRGGPGILLRL